MGGILLLRRLNLTTMEILVAVDSSVAATRAVAFATKAINITAASGCRSGRGASWILGRSTQVIGFVCCGGDGPVKQSIHGSISYSIEGGLLTRNGEEWATALVRISKMICVVMLGS
ncbi:Hypothetical predicted protein [Olea europaea subsp. europaea]|uniref:Uncharacterized protein n=1 Tax=Olea europaea subsp. europaea TaxID=158383 RepID=A0A8S0UL25_OLEEU|nr:Hypothetical predicted protein [Olea europaea subsp. europaea]